MTTPSYLLSVTTAGESDAVTLHGDREGLLVLRDAVDRLLGELAKGECDHAHLRSHDWAGFELTTSMLQSEKAAGAHNVHHLQICAWTPEWRQKHGL
jgi:ectoine hydroxylase-related dioxygenase (phytanoyl-CoA dioxygenase family)